MPAGDLVVADWQVEVRGYLLGPGTPWRVGGLDRWSSRSVRAEDTPRGSQRGSLAGLDLTNAELRGLSVNAGQGNIVTTPAELVALRDELRAAWAAEAVDVPVIYQLGGQKRLRWGRTRDIDIDEESLVVGYITAELEFLDVEGVELSALEHAVVTGPDVPGAGFAVPFTPPFSLPAGTMGTVGITASGRLPSAWTATITGPVNPASAPLITHLDTGEYLDLSANGGLEVPAGQHVVLDSATRSVRLNGVADRRVNLTTSSRWFSLTPGANSIRFAGTGTLEIRHRDTW